MVRRIKRGVIPAGQGTMDRRIAVIGGGPAGLMAAEMLSAAGQAVTVFDAKPTVARKFLMAGKSGLNIANVEDDAALRRRYGDAAGWLVTALDRFGATAIRDWMAGLGVDSFVGTSGPHLSGGR
jgi:predicted flavoprotein YhiN